jgi:hypothetical protein
MLIGGAVGAQSSIEAAAHCSGVPGRHLENDGCAAMLVLSEEVSSGVPELEKGSDVPRP